MALLLGGAMTISAFAQGTAFTYQGQLSNGTNPANGTYDLQFTLFTTNVTGTAVAGPVTSLGMVVNNGLFTVPIDFGQAFTGTTNWLQLAVRTNGAVTFANLAPRQQLTPVPNAIYAENASAAGLSGTLPAGALPANVAYVNAANNFSQQNIFTSTIKSVGPVSANGYFGFLEEDASDTGDFWILTKWDGSLNKRFSIYDGNGVTPLVLQEHGGNVGIGTLAPTNALQVSGTVSATSFSGPGTNLTGVALLNGGNAFNGNQSVSGSVGIGTISPVSALDVNGAGHFNAGWAQGFYAASITNQASTGWVAMNQGLTNAPGYVSWYGPNSYEIAYLGFVNGGATNLGLNLVNNAAFNINGGNVGIGTTTPATALQVAGTVSATAFSGNGSGLTGLNATNLTGTIASGSLPSGVAMLNGGNFFNGLQTVTNLGFGYKHSDGNHVVGDYIDALGGRIGTITDDPFGIFVNSQGPSLLVNSNGLVGIGTTTPVSALQVNGTVTATSFSGDGSGLGNVALLNSANTFAQQQTFKVSVYDYGCLTTDGTNTLGSYIGEGQCSFGTISSHALGLFANNGNDSMDINTNGNVGIGTIAPAGHLSVVTANGTVNIMDGPFTPELVMTGGGAPGDLRLRNRLEVWPSTNLTAAGYLDVRATNGTATISLQGTNGLITCVTLNQTSDRNAKQDFAAVSPLDVLAKVASLPVTEWSYRTDAAVHHIGPMAQDFQAAFNVGTDDKHIATVDEGGVALAAIQGLNQKLEEKDARIAALETRLEKLEQLIDQKNGAVK